MAEIAEGAIMNQDKREEAGAELHNIEMSDADREAVLDALAMGVTLNEILEMPELLNWPDAHAWIRATVGGGHV